MKAQLDILCPLVQPQKRLQVDLRKNNNQSCQKTELYGIQTTKDLKKPHLSRCVGEAEGEAWCRGMAQKGGSGGRRDHPTFTYGG